MEEAGAADVADDRDVAQLLEHAAELALLAQHVPAEVLLLEDLEVAQRDGGGDRVAAEGRAVREARLARGERLEDLLGGDQRAHRHVGAGQRLGAS